jgi:MFS family permease
VFKHRALPFGLYFTASALGGVAGPLMVLAVLHGFHNQWRMFWQVQMAATFAAGLVSAAFVGGRRWLEEAAQHTDQEVAAEVARPVRRGVYRTATDWSVRDALRTPQFYVLLSAYFGHLLIGATVSSSSVAHLTERGVSLTVAATMLSLESLAQTGARAFGGMIGDRLDPRYILVFALGALMVGAGALSIAHDYPTMLLYAVGSGLGFGLTSLSVTLLLLNYFGRTHNLELFSLTCLIGAVSSLGPTLGGFLRDRTDGFTSTFQLYAGVIAVVFVGALLMRPPRARSFGVEEIDRPGPQAELADRL